MGNAASRYTQTSLNCMFIMLLADDVVLLSYTPVGLQHQLNLLARNADALDLTVNLEKSNIVVFRNGGYLARCEKWYYKDSVVKVVNAYKYLGVWFSTRFSFSHSLESQKAKAKAGIAEILKILWKLGDVSPNIFFIFIILLFYYLIHKLNLCCYMDQKSGECKWIYK